MAPMCKFLKALFLGMVFRSKWRRSSKCRGRNRKGGQIFSVGDYSQDLSRFPGDDKVDDDDIFGVLGTVGTIGTVFWGQLADGSEIAVKRLDTSKMKGVREFSAQAKLLGSIRHKNILTLRGYCAEGKERLLVYDYMINLSLHTHLHGSLSSSLVLDWSRRMTIAIGAAEGLMHLHHKTSPPTVHGDIKSNNILLDKNFEAKWADFGLIKLMQEAWLMKGGKRSAWRRTSRRSTEGISTFAEWRCFRFRDTLAGAHQWQETAEKMGTEEEIHVGVGRADHSTGKVQRARGPQAQGPLHSRRAQPRGVCGHDVRSVCAWQQVNHGGGR
ncbi:hypothetical protein Mapa_013279 [Marchantia paleacea]|nr:hypothetical protein Mapa_013279 [Marchantia paleacea]